MDAACRLCRTTGHRRCSHALRRAAPVLDVLTKRDGSRVFREIPVDTDRKLDEAEKLAITNSAARFFKPAGVEIVISSIRLDRRSHQAGCEPAPVTASAPYERSPMRLRREGGLTLRTRLNRE